MPLPSSSGAPAMPCSTRIPIRAFGRLSRESITTSLGISPQTVVGRLDSILPEPSGFDVEQPFTSPVNQEAAAQVTEELGL